MRVSLTNVRTLGADGEALTTELPPADQVLDLVRHLLDETSLAAWSTIGAGGTAHVNIGYFARSDELYLYLWSHPRSLHCRNVAANPTMAVAVFPSEQNWAEPGRGVQLFGRCTEVRSPETADAARIYGGRYHAYEGWRSELKPGNPALAYRFYRFMPERLKILAEREFGDAVFVTADVVRSG